MPETVELIELDSIDEIIDVLAGNVDENDLWEFKKCGVRVGHA